MSLRKISFLGALAFAGALFAGAAQARGHIDWSVNINVPGRVYSEPAYYAPPAVYYAPPPATYYRPPVVVYRPGPPVIVGGSWRHRHHDRHHRHWRHERRGHDHHHGGHRRDGRR